MLLLAGVGVGCSRYSVLLLFVVCCWMLLFVVAVVGDARCCWPLAVICRCCHMRLVVVAVVCWLWVFVVVEKNCALLLSVV